MKSEFELLKEYITLNDLSKDIDPEHLEEFRYDVSKSIGFAAYKLKKNLKEFNKAIHNLSESKFRKGGKI